MKNLIDEINHLLVDRNMNRTHLADGIHMSRQNLSRILSNSKVKADIHAGTLENIARVLQVPITYFFDKDVWPTSDTLNGHTSWKHQPKETSGKTQQKTQVVSFGTIEEILKEKLEILKERSRIQDEILRMVQLQENKNNKG